MAKHENHSEHLNKVTAAGMLIAIGIVFGDIGTSPLYTFSAIIGTRTIEPILALGGLSAIFWTLTFQTTLKYVIIALRADNNGEGGIFSLYALVKRYSGKWLLYPAIIGGSFLLADGIITPPISISSAIEGLRIYSPDLPTVPIVIVILVLLFLSQQFGTQLIGKFFGPVMMVWFTFIGIIGAIALSADFTVLKALNPYYAYQMLTEYPHGFFLLGAVFLCTTGAEALYSDMGHCGRGNIRMSWIYVKICLILCYAGQAAFLVSRAGTQMEGVTPFYSIVPPSILPLGIIISTLAELSNDTTLPQYATHLVYLTASDSPKKIEQETIRSVLEKTPKRADVYWFLHVKTANEPFTMKYKVDTLAKEDVYFMTFTLGFRIEPRINYFFDMALEDLQKSKEVNITSRHPALEKYNIDGDVRFVLHSSFLSYENDLSFKQNLVMRSYYFLRRWFSIREDAAYGLDASNVVIEKVPIVVCRPEDMKITRET